jgi:hypothetical protein
MEELLDAFGEELPVAGSPWEKSAADVRTWLHLNEELPAWLSSIFGDAAAGFGGAAADGRGLMLAHADVLRRTLAVERMAADDFNFRTDASGTYRERSQAAKADFSPELRERIVTLTDQLGLVRTRPPRSNRYDKTLILGGGYRSPLLRARYAAQLQAAGVDLGEVSFLGSPRFLTEEPPERPVVETYAPDATDEFDLMIGAAHTEFGLSPAEVTFLCGCASTNVQCPRWRYRQAEGADRTPPAYTHERQVDLLDGAGRPTSSALSASTGRPPYRPQTSDTFALWAQCFHPQPGQRLLVVTTQVFVPFQTFDGVRQLYLPHGVDIDTVGFGAAWGDRPQTAEYLLQETLSAIRSARRLLIEAAEVLTQPAS